MWQQPSVETVAASPTDVPQHAMGRSYAPYQVKGHGAAARQEHTRSMQGSRNELAKKTEEAG